MGIVLLHGGQTGVDRGAHVGATDNGWAIKGYMPKNGRDELGPIPNDVARHLDRCVDASLPARTRANVMLSQAVLFVVPDKDNPQATPGTALTMRLAVELSRPREVIDPRDPEAHVRIALWLRNLGLRQNGAAVGLVRDLRLVVAGPRATRWNSGEVETAGFLRRLKLELYPPKLDLDGDA